MTQEIMLDSGAFTAYTKGIVITLEEYASFIHEYRDHFQGGYINLDVINNGKASYRNWKQMREQGLDPIPVYHLGTDEKWLKRYLKQTDYVAIGAIAKLNTKARIIGLDYIWKKYLLDDEGSPRVKVHGLGLTTPDIITRFPWYSVDSMTAAKMAAFGFVIVPRLVCTGNAEYRVDMSTLAQFRVTMRQARSNSSLTSINNYHTLPPTVQAAYKKYFKDRGYEIGTPGEIGSRERRKDKPPTHTLLPLPEEKQMGEDGNALMNDWLTRLNYNVDFWDEYRHRMKDLTVFHVVSNVSNLAPLKRRELPVLISYEQLRARGKIFRKITGEGEADEG